MDRSEFEKQWTADEPRVRSFLAAGCRDATLVNDLAQEVAMTAWRKRGDFDAERSFAAWVVGIARFALLRHRRDMARAKVILAPDLLERLESLATEEAPAPDQRRQALAQCLDKLGDEDRALVQARYENGTPLAEAAEKLGRTHGAVRTALARLRDRLRRCVQERLGEKAEES